MVEQVVCVLLSRLRSKGAPTTGNSDPPTRLTVAILRWVVYGPKRYVSGSKLFITSSDMSGTFRIAVF